MRESRDPFVESRDPVRVTLASCPTPPPESCTSSSSKSPAAGGTTPKPTTAPSRWADTKRLPAKRKPA
jgi:hypothetical protein